MEKYKIKTATALYTGGGIYVFYGQLENGLYFSIGDGEEPAYICDADTSTEDATWWEFFEAHTVEELNGADFKTFFNAVLSHVLNGGAAHDEWANFSRDELETMFLKQPISPPTFDELTARISEALENELARIYDELEIDSGDISPTQSLEWDEATAKIAYLFRDLIDQNK